MTAMNILYVFTDQQSANAMSCAGNRHLRTRALDGLAARGVHFKNAYSSFPLCVPARASMFTGRMPHELGVYANCFSGEIPSETVMLGKLSADAGYETSYIGKWHIPMAENKKSVHGFSEVIFGGGYGDMDSRKADEAVSFLRRPHKRPFFLTVAFNNPHDCCEYSRGDSLRMGELPPPPPVQQCPPVPDNFDVSANEPDAFLRFVEENSFFRCSAWSEDACRRYRWGYNRLVEMVDHQIGRILEALDDAGLTNNTMVIFSSDHGDGQTAHRLNQKWSLYDESAKVPFVVAGPGVPAGRIEDAPISATLDLMPTILDWLGLPIPDTCRGTSLTPVLTGDATPSREYVVSETGLGVRATVGEDRWPKGRMVRTRRYKYITFDAGTIREQLFDMLADPGEMRNLAVLPECAGLLKRHRDFLAEWIGKTNDGFQTVCDHRATEMSW